MFGDSLEDAIGFIEKGKLAAAQKTLKRLIAKDHHDLRAWFWFLETCSTKEQRINVMEICLEYNPNNEQVKQALNRLQSAPAQNPPLRSSSYSTSSSNSTSISSNNNLGEQPKTPLDTTMPVVKTTAGTMVIAVLVIAAILIGITALGQAFVFVVFFLYGS